MAARRARRAEAAKRAVNQEPPVSGTSKIAVEEEPAPATERDPAPPVEEPAPVSVEQAVSPAPIEQPIEQPIEVPDDAIELSTVRLFRADSDGHDGRKWDGARKWCTSAGMLFVAEGERLRVYAPGTWWGVAEDEPDTLVGAPEGVAE